jgi:hypothetical protein
MTTDERQAVLDEEHLRLLSLFHYVSGGLTLVFSLFFGIWLGFMSAMLSMVPKQVHAGAGGNAPPIPPELPMIFLLIFGSFFVLGVVYGVLQILAGRWMARRRRRVLTIIVAIPGLAFIPYGLMLSLFTLLVLDRKSVKELYRAPAAL